MDSRPTLPYFAPANLLPAPLPTVAEILASTERLSNRFARVVHVARVGQHFAVKFGRYVHLQEGENMLFVRSCTSVPVPTVYALFHDETSKSNFIVMEYIPGKTLGQLWSGLSTLEKTAVASQLRQNLDELRRIPSPGYYGGIWRQPTREFTFADDSTVRPHPDETISGPQETEEQWADAMWRCLDTRVKPENQSTVPMLRSLYQIIFKGHKSVFTHADLFLDNIIIREDTKSAVFIDWERSGWYPSFWEYCLLMTCIDCREDDWWKYVPSVLDQYVAELGWMRTHREALLWY
ncbi:kinase-like domain-containing protein [Chaetomidium leptoderma]|uniref:Kinase-like domain-containing protein n=1 Tax=Chaetomidium leptoderma TaxID=669021 RepID=A0AAN6VMH7_9PEZI|nr:kinase-like domain-containing protein [Chaetomidium leptoderma]